MFNPSRLTLARQRRKLTKKAFAEVLTCDQKTIIRYESGEVEPPAESVSAIADALGFPEAFFFGADIDEPIAEAASFRSLSGMTARDRDAALAAGSLSFLLSDWVDQRFALPEVDLPEFKENSNPEGAARALREHWGLGERPIKSMTQLLEAKGVRVFSLAENTRMVDAFSMWRRDRPYVFLNTMKTAERSRFDAAHELGHLALHKYSAPNGRDAESEADRFGSAFLMPEADVKAKLPRVTSINQIIQAKQRWGVSVAALNYRLHKLGASTDWQYRQFCIQIAKYIKSNEPNPMERDRSIVWQKVFDALREEKIGKIQISEELGLPVVEVENLIFRLANMQSIEGSGVGGGKSRARLSVVPK